MIKHIHRFLLFYCTQVNAKFSSHLRNIHSTLSLKIRISFSVITGIHTLSGGGRTLSNGAKGLNMVMYLNFL
jgi:hypothetical protein